MPLASTLAGLERQAGVSATDKRHTEIDTMAREKELATMAEFEDLVSNCDGDLIEHLWDHLYDCGFEPTRWVEYTVDSTGRLDSMSDPVWCEVSEEGY